ncbi:RNA polymerase sigma factor [Chitinophaga sp.]|uniref:RNA polymerase sigma factor n=1 Tax=Chitinophaga sp. TaxID=1869181 RepID=UPI002F92E3FB
MKNMSFDEKIILQQVANGSETAFASLFHHWQPYLSTHIHRITASRVLTEEIVQDVFLKIWMSRETLNEISHFQGYLLAMSRNHALNALKLLMRQLDRMNVEELEQHMTYADSEEGEIPRQYVLTLIDEGIEHLSPRQKEIYLLHRHQKRTYSEIAAQLGIGRESVKTHLQLAVKSLTAYIKEHLGLIILLLEMHDKKIF